MYTSSNLRTEDSSGYTRFSIGLEGFNEPLFVSVPKQISAEEFEALSTEILNNYVMDLKEKGKIDESRDDLMLISDTDYHQLAKADLTKHLSSFRKIIIGYSEIETLKHEFP